jgi:hypothetical protein
MVPVNGEGLRLSPPDKTRPGHVCQSTWSASSLKNQCPEVQTSTFNLERDWAARRHSQCPIGHLHFLLFVALLRLLGRPTMVGLENLVERGVSFVTALDETEKGRRCGAQALMPESLHRSTLLIYDPFSFGVGGKGNNDEPRPCCLNSWSTRAGPSHNKLLDNIRKGDSRNGYGP